MTIRRGRAVPAPHPARGALGGGTVEELAGAGQGTRHLLREYRGATGVRQRAVAGAEHALDPRVSLGLATNFADVFRFVTLMQGFANRSAVEIGQAESATRHGDALLDAA